MTDAELIAQLRAALDYHEGQAERYRKMLAIAEDGAGTPEPPKAKRSGEQRRPPSRRPGAAVRLPPEQHPKYGEARKLSEGGMKLTEVATAIGLPLTTLRNWRARGKWK